jgi:N-acetylneuraminic acid mutarotase
MRKLYTVLTVLLTVSFLFDQNTSAQITTTAQWTWMSGDNTLSVNGVYGTKGVASATNKPGGREASVTWSDASGNLWLFGGYGYGASGYSDVLSDMWKYNIASNQWTWMKGNNTTATLGVYGTQGTAAAANNPGGRLGSSSWKDASGKFWLFGGSGYDDGSYGFSDYLNDLWRYDPATNNWTWMKGSKTAAQSGTYGTQGTAANANNPGARQGSASWIDASGNLWLFGGIGYDYIGNWDDMNDLWKYNPSTNQWTWIKGPKTAGAFGTYGTQGTAAAANTPGARDQAVSWIDGSGNLWLFGGYGYDDGTNFFGYLNDLWKYNPSTNQWTWIKGTKLADQLGVYGTLGVASAGNVPGGRDGLASWTDAAGKFWLFGGEGYDDGSGPIPGDDLGDLWSYDPATNNWTWVKGDNMDAQGCVYGIQGVQAASNKPGSRDDGLMSWIDAAGNFWLFGGDGYIDTYPGLEGLQNDLWKLSPVVVPVTLTNIKAYEKGSGINVEWTFTQEIDMDRYEVEKSVTGANFNHGGTVVSTGNHSSAITYSWVDANPNRGANFYRVKMFDKNGQVSYSQVVKVVIGRGASISIYPNPVTNGSLTLQFDDQSKGSYNIRILNSLGQMVFKTIIDHTGGSATQTIQLPLSLSKGMYNLEVISPDGTMNVERMIVGSNH